MRLPAVIAMALLIAGLVTTAGTRDAPTFGIDVSVPKATATSTGDGIEQDDAVVFAGL